MKKEVLIIEVEREGYSVPQCPPTMTVGELMMALSDFDESTPIYFSHDNGYTYGSLKAANMDSRFINEEGEK